jgi:hypothetical protein
MERTSYETKDELPTAEGNLGPAKCIAPRYEGRLEQQKPTAVKKTDAIDSHPNLERKSRLYHFATIPDTDFGFDNIYGNRDDGMCS